MAVEILHIEQIRDGEYVNTPASGKKGPTFELKDFGILLWVILFGFGGGILSLYYANVGYIPDIKWDESLVYLGMLTIVGFFLFFVYGLLLFIPGCIWSMFLVRDHYMGELLKEGPCDQRVPCVRSMFIYIVGPFSVLMLLVHTFLFVASSSAFLLGAILAILLACFWVLRNINRAFENGDLSCPEQRRFRYVGIFALSVILSVLSLIVIRWLSVVVPEGPMSWVCTLVVVLVNLFVAVLYESYPKESVALAVVAALALLILSDLLVDQKNAKLSARMMHSFGLGFDHQVTLLVKGDARQTLKGLGIESEEISSDSSGDGVVPSNPPEKGAENLLQIDNVEILSRLGPDYFLRVDKRSFPLKKENVVSWANDDPKQLGAIGPFCPYRDGICDLS
jgi:hypothetical protein